MDHAYTGPEYSDAQCGQALRAAGLDSELLDDDTLFRTVAERIAAGEVIGWFQGRMEFGPRALGNRSIVTDPRRDDMKDILNARIKHREPFRPFAPSILAERTGDWYEQDYTSPFMILVYRTKADKRDKIPAVNHVDDTGRLQTVERARQSALLPADRGVRAADGRADPPQHVLQRERAHRDDPGARGRDLPEDAHGRARARQLLRAPRVTTRPRLLVFNQYYRPGVEATANLLADLCSDLARDFDVTVVTATLKNAPAGREVRDGVEIVRVRSTAFERRRLWLRALNYLTFLVQSLRVGLTSERPDVVFAMTDPPVIGNVALIVARRFRVPLFVVVQDVFPETAVRLGRIGNPAVIAVLRMLVRAYLRRADRVVAIGETMRDTARGEGRARGARDGDSELDRHERACAGAARQRMGA